MLQLVKCLLVKPEDLSLIQRTHIKIILWGGACFVILGLKCSALKDRWGSLAC